jgi:hypothetical protein
VRGDTQGAAVVMEDATITIGNNDLIEGVDFKCTKGERWAFVGPNGEFPRCHCLLTIVSVPCHQFMVHGCKAYSPCPEHSLRARVSFFH